MKRFFFFPLFGILFAVAGTFAVMALWNMVLTSIFALPLITFWQALGLLVLSRILFGGFGCGWHGKRHHEFRRRWMHMTPEEREQMRSEWRGCCGWSSPPKPTDQPQ